MSEAVPPGKSVVAQPRRLVRLIGLPVPLPLYRDVSLRPSPRSQVVVDGDWLTVIGADRRERRFVLHGVMPVVMDAAAQRRFVRMLVVDGGGERTTIITPPEQGAIAPRASRLPEVPVDANVLERPEWDALEVWLAAGGRLASCSVAELARLTTIASPHFAIVLGEVVAAAAMELVWEAASPRAGGLDLEAAMRPLMELSRRSPRAADAWVAALAVVAGLSASETRRRR